MIIDHIGIVVRSLEMGIQHWKDIFGYEQLTEPVVNIRQKVKVVFLKKENSTMIKLLEPIDETSPVFNMAKKGGGLHHLCFKCDDMDFTLTEMKEKGLRIITHPQPGEAFENEKIAFFYSKDGVNIELIDTDKRAKCIIDNK
ncbi:MAG: VOC family protein [Tissierellales bacterium]|nr:VOC family protein [Tissierellales bacterium]